VAIPLAEYTLQLSFPPWYLTLRSDTTVVKSSLLHGNYFRGQNRMSDAYKLTAPKQLDCSATTEK